MTAEAQLGGGGKVRVGLEGDAGQRDEMKASTGTFHSLPGAFRGSKDAGESEEGMERWGRRGGVGRGAKQRRRRRRSGGWRGGRGHSVRRRKQADA